MAWNGSGVVQLIEDAGAAGPDDVDGEEGAGLPAGGAIPGGNQPPL
jgi:hypothetical protein